MMIAFPIPRPAKAVPPSPSLCSYAWHRLKTLLQRNKTGNCDIIPTEEKKRAAAFPAARRRTSGLPALGKAWMLAGFSG
jgi:hypothetical protein